MGRKKTLRGFQLGQSVGEDRVPLASVSANGWMLCTQGKSIMGVPWPEHEA